MHNPGKDILSENNIFVACQTSDDLPYILDAVGDDNIVVGTDYGHNDTATEIDALRKLREQGTIDADERRQDSQRQSEAALCPLGRHGRGLQAAGEGCGAGR